MKSPRLEVIIATCGEGINRIPLCDHPQVEGVAYTVCWQTGDSEAPIPPQLAERTDFRVVRFETKGLSVNRNHGLDMARGEILLISDDDLSYTPDALSNVIRAFDEHRDADFITFKYDTPESPKHYCSHSFDWNRPPKGAYMTSFELAVRREAMGNTRFNTSFGIGATFTMGEEELFIAALMRRGLKGIFIPETICTHPTLTTGSRVSLSVTAEVKGAAFVYLHPHSWPLRMVAHALRNRAPIAFVGNWLGGAIRALRLKVFEGY